MSKSMSNCFTCGHILDKSSGWCAMYNTEPPSTCHRHTAMVERWKKLKADYKSTHPGLTRVEDGCIFSHPTKEVTDEKD